MPQKPTVLCPIDYSDHSRVALRYAALIADHFGARLLLVTVNDLLLVQAAAMAYDAEFLQLQSHQDLREFYRDPTCPARLAQTTSRMTSAPESQHQRSSRPRLTVMQISSSSALTASAVPAKPSSAQRPNACSERPLCRSSSPAGTPRWSRRCRRPPGP